MRTVVTMLVIAALSSACANEPVGSGGGGIDHPTGGDEIVLRVSDEGGFVPVEYNLTRLPSFTLFGDGTILVPGAQIAIYPGPALPPIVRRTVNDDGIQAILGAALDAGLDQDLDLSDTGSMLIADATTTVFTLTAEGRTTRVSVYALGAFPDRPEGMSEEEFELRNALTDLVERLGGLDRWLPDGSIGPEGAYRPDGARVFAGRYRSDRELPQEPVRWPLDEPLEVGPQDTAGYACRAVTGGEWETLSPRARDANQLTPWVSDGDRFALLFRPLLPDESGC